jgi:hypothetical protein
MKKPFLTSGIITILFILICLPVLARPGEKEIKNILVIGWDAADRSKVNDLLKKGQLPNLAALIQEGKMLEIDIVSGATDTKAGWAQLLTGYVPEKTGVYNNGRYEPIPKGYTVFERLEKFFGPEHIDTVAVIAKKDHVDHDPPFRGSSEEWNELVEKHIKRIRGKFPFFTVTPESALDQAGGRVVVQDGRRMVEVPGKPWYKTSKGIDLWVNGLEENEIVTQRVLSELEKRKNRRFFFFVHFAQPDHLGHRFGENSKEYESGYLMDDECSGRIIKKIKEIGLYDKTLIYIVSDHGFDKNKKTHLYAPFVFVATNDPTPVRGEGTREDLAPTILKKFGLDVSGIEPRLDGYPFDIQAPARMASPILTEEYRHRYNYINNKEINAKKVIHFD